MTEGPEPLRPYARSVLLLSGAGAYADAWHAFPATSERLAAALTETGAEVRVSDDVEAELLRPVEADLLVLNLGSPAAPRPEELMRQVHDTLRDHLARGGALLGVHSSANGFPTMPGWSSILGGRWVAGTSMHPPLSPTTITVRTGHPITDGLDDLELVDERYSDLRTEPDITVLGEHEHDGRWHPMIWAHTVGAGRVVYDALGHDTRSYDSPSRLELLRREVGWLLDRSSGPPGC